MTRKSTQAGKLWWRSLTAEQQADKRCEWLEAKGKIPNWDYEYTRVIEENNYMK